MVTMATAHNMHELLKIFTKELCTAVYSMNHSVTAMRKNLRLDTGQKKGAKGSSQSPVLCRR